MPENNTIVYSSYLSPQLRPALPITTDVLVKDREEGVQDDGHVGALLYARCIHNHAKALRWTKEEGEEE